MKKRKSAFLLLAAALLTLCGGRGTLLTAYAEEAVTAESAEEVSSAADTSQGWVKEGGAWCYYKDNGELLTESWRKDGGKRYYLDEEGEMAVDRLIEYGGEKYYCGSDGAMVKSKWVSVPALDDDWDWEADVNTVWYYFRSNGAAHRDGKKKIDGQYYLFDEEGRMLSGWQAVGDDPDWCYLGEEDEGFLHTGWQKLTPDDRMDGDYEAEEWFYFQKGSGKAYRDTRKKINGYYYAFDENGVMKDKWQTGEPDSPDYIDPATGRAATSSSFYQEDGRAEKGWVYTYAPDDVSETGDEGWFYLDKNGVPFNYHSKDTVSASERGFNYAREMNGSAYLQAEVREDTAAKVIKGKTYLFDGDGRMMTGTYYLQGIRREGGSMLGHVPIGENLFTGAIYYFNTKEGPKEGQMMTGRQTVDCEGELYHYYFRNDGKAYTNFIADDCLYDSYGIRVDADRGYELIDIKELLGEHIEIHEKGSSRIHQDCLMIVGTSGKVKKSGTVRIDGTRYTVENYEVVNIEN